MPLSKLQTDVLRVLASRRDPESYVAGGAPLNRDRGRFSEDIDIFHDREERVAAAARGDAETLAAAGFRVTWLRQLPLVYTVEIGLEDASTRLEWVVDSDYRFFPTVPDDLFGYVLNPVDLAINKLMAAAGRRELRDIVDLVEVHDAILSLGALTWAAVEKSPGFTPEGLIGEIRRNACYPAAEWRALASVEPIDPADTLRRLRAALDDADAFVARMPTDKLGLRFSRTATSSSPILTASTSTRRMRANGAAIGRPAQKSRQRCWSDTQTRPATPIEPVTVKADDELRCVTSAACDSTE